MRQKKTILWILCAALLVLLTAMLLPRLLPSQESRYTRRVEEELFCVGMERLNCTLAEPFTLQKGDTIDVSVDQVSGELAITIGQENREPIYEGRNPQLGSFRVTVPEDGSYLLSVTGKQARGNISFQINAG